MTAHVESRKPFRLPAGAGQSVWSLGGRFTVKADSAATENRFSLLEVVAYRTTEPPLHVDHHEDEAWYVLDGHLTFYVDDAVLDAPAGSFVYAPRGLPHDVTVDIEPTRGDGTVPLPPWDRDRGTAAADDGRGSGNVGPGATVIDPEYLAERLPLDLHMGALNRGAPRSHAANKGSTATDNLRPDGISRRRL